MNPKTASEYPMNMKPWVRSLRLPNFETFMAEYDFFCGAEEKSCELFGSFIMVLTTSVNSNQTDYV